MSYLFVASSTYFLGSIGIVANVVLLIVIVKCTPAYLKGFSQIMFASAICDSFGLVAMIGTCAKEVIFKWSCVIEYFGVCKYFSAEMCAFQFGIQCEMVSTSVMLMCFSFFYRYNMLQNVVEISLRKMRFLFLLVIIVVNMPVLLLVYRVTMRGSSTSNFIAEYKLNHPSVQEVLGIVHSQDPEAQFLLACAVVTSVMPFTLSIVLRHLTIRQARTLNSMMSKTKQQLQAILVQVLNFQLAIASCFFLGGSFFLIDLIEFPLLRNTSILAIPLSNLQNVCTPNANIFLITPYRKYCVTYYEGMLFHSQSVHICTKDRQIPYCHPPFTVFGR